MVVDEKKIVFMFGGKNDIFFHLPRKVTYKHATETQKVHPEIEFQFT